jgi:hypothetical protein
MGEYKKTIKKIKRAKKRGDINLFVWDALTIRTLWKLTKKGYAVRIGVSQDSRIGISVMYHIEW